MGKIFEINSLSEYVNFVSKNNLNNFISRGENKKFDNIIASAFRYQKPIKFQNIILQFYNTIGNDVTTMQRDNFVAFSQHHGIPTNLIDFSTSPLVSLFFACYDINASSDKSGYVYFIDKSRLIDITDMMILGTAGEGIFQDLMRFNSNIAPIITKLYTYEHTHTQEIQQIIIDWTDKLRFYKVTQKKYSDLFPVIDKFCEELKVDPDFTLHTYSEKLLKQIVKSNKSDNGVLSDFFLWDEHLEACSNLLRSTLKDGHFSYDNDIFLILILMRTVIGELFDYSNAKDLMKNFDLPFYFTYSPPNILSRIENQASLFIYQLYYDYDVSDPYLEKIKHRLKQNISPDYILRINNKGDILNSLDSVGINLKFIYNDYDSIAKYIKSKSLEL